MKQYTRRTAAAALAALLAAGLASCSIILDDPAAGTVTAPAFAGGGTTAPADSAATAAQTAAASAETGNAPQGRFSSDQSVRLRLLLDYSRTAGADGRDTLTLTVRLSSYSLEVGERQNLGKLTCGGESLTFSTPALEISENSRVTETVLFSHTLTVPSGEPVAVSASWLFNGTYAGVELGTLAVSGTVPALE